MRPSTLLTLALALLARGASAHPVAVGNTRFHDSVDASCRFVDVNAAPFAAPDLQHPWGTVISACFRPGGDDPIAVVREVDLSSGATVREASFPAAHDATQIRVATGNGRVLVIVSAAMDDRIDPTMLRLLDDHLHLVHEWNLGFGGFTNVAADGNLAAVVVDSGAGIALRSVDLARGRIIAKRVDAAGWMRVWGYPFASVAVHDASAYLAFSTEESLVVRRFSKRLQSTGRASYAMPLLNSSQFFLAPTDTGSVVVGTHEWVDVLRAGLARQSRLAAPPLEREGVPARWAIDPGTGRVATEDGQIAAHVGAPFKRVLRYTNEVVGHDDVYEYRADMTRAVTWAFGRVVITRDAPGLGITAIEPR